MTRSRTSLNPSRGVLALFAAVLVGGIACHRGGSNSAVRPASVPRLPDAQISATPVLSIPPETSIPLPDEARVTLITGDHDMDVKQALEYIAKRGGYGLAMSPNLKTRVRLNLVDVPVSEALQAVLAQANLTISPNNGKMEVAWNPSVVFYQLATNVDSLTVQAIMKRYGVSSDMAQVIVNARRP
jgi:hypothetical protein